MLQEVTVAWERQRLLLFIVIDMDEQSQNAHDQLADQNQFRMSHHVYHLLPEKGGEQEVCSSSHWEGPPAYRHWQRLGVL